MVRMSAHNQRAHSKFSASGSERWLNCAASVALEEKSPPSADSVWSIEGTRAHEVLEVVLKLQTMPEFMRNARQQLSPAEAALNSPDEMVRYAADAWAIIRDEILPEVFDPEILIEQRIYNSDIHAEMFGTVDVAVVELYGTLHVIDYKFGQGHIVNPKENTQMIQYALGLAAKYDWQFDNVVVHIIQPRGGGKTHKFWPLSIDELRDKWRPLWVKGVQRVEAGKSKPFPGSYCYWCRASKPGADGKIVCPVKREQIQEVRTEKTVNQFSQPFKGGNFGKEESKKEIKPSKQKSGSKKIVEAFDEGF
jgi:hypothetical protein